MSEAAFRLRRIADAYERGEGDVTSDDPVIERWLRIYREACPSIAFGLRAYANALEARDA
jgi:hypothetical protein